MGQALSFFVAALTRPRDAIRIHELALALAVAHDDDDGAAPKHTRVLLSLTIPHDVARAAHTDDLACSIDYAAVYATLVETLPTASYASLEALLDRVFDALFSAHPQLAEVRAVAALHNTVPQCTVEATRKRDATTPEEPTRCTLAGLGFATIVGVLPHERTKTQPVVLDIVVERTDAQRFPFFTFATSIRQTFAASAYQTIEALASAVARHVLEHATHPGDKVTVQVAKPGALPLAASAQVSVTRQRSDLAHVPKLPGALTPAAVQTKSVNGLSSSSHSIALALGSNLGDRFANIETALRLLEIPTTVLSDLPEGAKVAVVDTSFMYETAPMYVTDQPRFANCACMIETNLAPLDLLRLVKAIETAVGRVPGKRNGPRAVDLDILTYDDQRMDTRPADARATLDNLIGELVVPHPRLCEREFVLRPLNDMIPDFVHPACHKSIRTLLDEVVAARRADDEPMVKVLPFPTHPFDPATTPSTHGVQVPPTATHWTVAGPTGRPSKTHLMAVLNVTPDSFSDGAAHDTVPGALAHAVNAVAAGADVVDVGGCSTRPGAAFVSAEEEAWRVVPVIEAIRTHADARVRQALVSVDTFQWEVAQDALRAGANCINDVHAFAGPVYPPDASSAQHRKAMQRVARAASAVVVLMHSRGEAGANKVYEGDVVGAVRAELGARVDAVVRGPGSVRRWLVLVDPGIGFSKPVAGQLALMRDLGRLTAEETGNALAGYPVLLGASKKSVLGAVLEAGDAVEGRYEGRKTDAGERGWATAAAVACGVQQGANVVRVHDVAEMRDVVAVASAIWSR